MAAEKPNMKVLEALREDALLTGMVAIMHWRIGDNAQRSIEDLHWVVHLVSLTEPEIALRAKEVMVHLSHDTKVLKKMEQEEAAIWSALVHDFDKGMRLSDGAMKTVRELRARLDARYKEVEALIAEAGSLHGVRMPPETHLIRPRWKRLTDFLERTAAGYARDKLEK